MSADTDDWLDLADAIELLRVQVAEAQRRSAGADVRFRLGEITVEFGMELTRTKGAGGGLRFGVASLEGRGERAAKATHHVTVRLDPRRADGSPVDTGAGESAGYPDSADF
ncbi:MULTISPECIES: trypco2 family protein [unclassified Embleya]|uniref:trypco2 family protein n=1 Tax=unclassified Embleya TaxID=2699296 RepID=UPI00340404F4